MAKLDTRLLHIGPEDPLRRRGLKLDSQKLSASSDAWADTLFAGPSLRRRPKEILDLLEKHGENLFSVLKKFVDRTGAVPETAIRVDDPPTPQDAILEALVRLGTLARSNGNHYRHTNKIATFGSTFEASVLHALEKMGFDPCRDGQVVYPREWGGSCYDPDGQKYDILAAVDFTTLLWVECKKPLYLSGSQDPLANVLSRADLRRFYKRAWRLRPEIAVYLVDTKEDYFCRLERHLTSGYTIVVPHPEELSEIVARLNGFIYFCRVDYTQPKNYLASLQRTLNQVLYDARSRPGVVKSHVGDLIT